MLSLLLPSATKLRRLCFYTCLSFCSGGGSASVHAGIPLPWTRHPLGADAPWTRHPPEQTPPGSRHPARSRHTPREQTPSRPGTPQGADTPLGTRHTPGPGVHPPADGYCCGRYASYWNAFLFEFILAHLIIELI